MKTNTSILNSSQELAVSSDSPHLLVLAGAGSGKTTTLIARIDRLLLDGVPPEQIVAITFTTAASQEIADRLALQWLPKPLGHVGTLHSFLLKLIQKHYLLLGYPSARLAVLDEEQASSLLQQCADDLRCGTSLRRLKEWVASGAQSGNLEYLVAKRYARTMQDNGVISYDAILTVGLRLIKLLDADAIPFQHILIDEFQDSGDLDAKIYEALPIPNKFFVGDDFQSIYGFRGAKVDYILSKARDIETTGNGELIRIEENYRSDRAICEAAQRLIEHNEDRVHKVMRTVSDEDGEVVITAHANSTEEMVKTNSRISAALNRGDSVAVLVRTNALVDEWRLNLVGYGFPVASRQRTDSPRDWTMTKAAIAVFNDPSNDWLCYSLVRIKDGEETAQEIKLKAAAANLTINEHTFHLGTEIPLAEFTTLLARLGVGSESMALVKSEVDKLPPEATGTDLMASLAAREHHTDEVGQGVFVSTIHGAKGKEFDAVFLPAFEQEIIPAKRDLSEERRLAFVGFTRARHRLFISWCESRKPAFGDWRPQPATASQFIAEAGL